ncbi:MAG: hypothetical protein U0840_03675 [Gemmataceae bacterium]
MWWYRFLPVLFTGVGVFLLAGALRQPREAAPPALPSELADLTQVTPEPSAAAPVHEALAHLNAPGAAWLQTTLWVQSHLRELPFEAEGSYVQAPGQRHRLELRSRRRSSHATEIVFLCISDGQNHQETTRHGSAPARGSPVMPHSAQFARGPACLVRSLLGTVAWIRARTQGDEVHVDGLWQPALNQQLAPKERPWPANLPRLCRLTLRGPQRWPARLTWYGPTRPGGRDTLLVELEYRDPVCGRVLSEETCARAFHVEPQ